MASLQFRGVFEQSLDSFLRRVLATAIFSCFSVVFPRRNNAERIRHLFQSVSQFSTQIRLCVKKGLISYHEDITVNDAILHQDDILHGELTVKENLSFQAWKGNRSGLVLVNAVHMSTLFPKYSQKQLFQQPPELLIDALLMQTRFNANSSLQLLWHQP